MFILLVKVVLFIMHMWIPLVSLIINVIVIALWCVSIYGQAGPDYSDPEHPSSVAWYIAKSCSYAEPSGNKRNCEMAKGAFASSIFMLYAFLPGIWVQLLTLLRAIFTANVVLSIWSMFPTKAMKEARKIKKEEEMSPSAEHAGEKLWELRDMAQPTPAFQPYTPRTLAFNTLDRQLPLREKYQYA